MYLEQVNPYSISKQHQRDKLHIIERIRLLFDADSFTEYYPETGDAGKSGYDGVITGYGNICGQRVYFYGQDFTCMGGTFGYHHSMQIVAILREAVRERKPIIGLYDGGGARIQEGAAAVAGCGKLFRMNETASGVIPQIAIIAGTCAGGAVYSPGLMDFVFTIEGTSNMFVTGAKVINEVQKTDYLIEELGGAGIHAAVSGVAHFRCENERSCFEEVRRLLDRIPPCYRKERLYRTGTYEEKDLQDIRNCLPATKEEGYDVRDVLQEILDTDSFQEVQKEFAPNIVVGLAGLGGITVGVVASQTLEKKGSVDCDSADKAARFVRYCDCYNIPILTFADSTGFVMEAEQEYKGLIRHGAKMVYAYAEATTIKLTVILRRAYGGPYIFFGCKQLGADRHYVWPDAEVAVMGAEGAVAVISHSRLAKLEGIEKQAFLDEQLRAYQKAYMNSDLVLERHFVDSRIEPEKTRQILYQDLLRLEHEQPVTGPERKHGNMPV